MSTQDLFPDSLADRLKARQGEPYRPSNGTEGEMFMDRWCHQCKRDADDANPCELPGLAMLFDLGDPDYPKEWQYSPDGQPKCTAFERREAT